MSAALDAEELFQKLKELGALRVISHCGPSTFEAICTVSTFGVAHGHINAITSEYHWHLNLNGFRHVTSHDEIHERSGRRVLFFELRENAGADPFLLIYLYRDKGAEFEPAREKLFLELHSSMMQGIKLASPTSGA